MIYMLMKGHTWKHLAEAWSSATRGAYAWVTRGNVTSIIFAIRELGNLWKVARLLQHHIFSLEHAEKLQEASKMLRASVAGLVMEFQAPAKQWQVSNPNEIAAGLTQIATLTSTAALSPGMLERARTIALEHAKLKDQLAHDYDVKVARRVGELTRTTNALNRWEETIKVCPPSTLL